LSKPRKETKIPGGSGSRSGNRWPVNGNPYLVVCLLFTACCLPITEKQEEQ